MLHFKSSSCLSSGKRWFEKSTYDKHTDSTILLKFHHPIKYSEWVFYFILLMHTGFPQFLKGNMHYKKCLKCSKWASFQGYKDSSIIANQSVWYTIIQTKRQKSCNFLSRCRESLWQNSTNIYDKNSPENRQKRNIPQHDEAITTVPQRTFSLMEKNWKHFL